MCIGKKMPIWYLRHGPLIQKRRYHILRKDWIPASDRGEQIGNSERPQLIGQVKKANNKTVQHIFI